MRKLTVLAAALAAGVTTFAARAQDTVDAKKLAAIEAAIETEASKDREDARELKAALAEARAEKAAALAGATHAAAASTKATGGRYGTIIAHYASTYGVPVSLAKAVIQVESSYRPDARGRAGEIGLMQIKPATARLMGYSGSNADLFHPETNIKFGMLYLAKAHRLGGGTVCGTILKYNAGHAAKRMNPVSSAYCSKVKRHLAGI
jgi:soluble lytic murein transglycosylase-like protein